MNESWHVYRNNPDQISEVRGRFEGTLLSLAHSRLAELGVGKYIAVFAGTHSKSDGVPPIRFIEVHKADVEVTVTS